MSSYSLREFVRKCIDHKLHMLISSTVYEELRNVERMIRKELLKSRKVKVYDIIRFIEATKQAIVKLLTHIDKLPTTKSEVSRTVAFYAKYEPSKSISPPVDKNDKIILAEALELKCQLFLTSNTNHFSTFLDELHQEFRILIVSQLNCGDCIRLWNW